MQFFNRENFEKGNEREREGEMRLSYRNPGNSRKNVSVLIREAGRTITKGVSLRRERGRKREYLTVIPRLETTKDSS